jgi:nucleotide-binding universal stress UspA family protein
MRNLVVGVDGAPSSLRALEWAAATVGPSGRIHAVAAVSPPTELAVVPPPTGRRTYLQLLQRELDLVWTADVRTRVETVDATAMEGSAAEALAAVAAECQADAIVVGAHVPMRTMPKTIGTTTRHLLKDLDRPLIVVPHQFSGQLDGDGPLIVGIGHGDATDAAVHWAARLADERDLSVGLVRATGEGPVFQVDGMLSLLAYYIDPAKRAEWTREDLADFAEEVQAMTAHELAIGVSAPAGLPAVRLVDASTAASLLVIGHHRSIVTGRQHTTEPLRHALTHARCPIAVIPARSESQS